MTAKLIQGREVANQIIADIAHQVEIKQAAGFRPPGLAVVLVGDDPASSIYVRHKQKACERAGVISEVHHLPYKTSQDELLKLVQHLNHAEHIDGLIVQLPLPEHIDNNLIVEQVNPHKDVDCFHPYNLGRLAQRRPHLRPCTPYGIMKLLAHANIDIRGKYCVVVGASNIVGRPMALELLLAKATVTVCHRFTQNLHEHVEMADILVVAIGKTDIVQSAWLKPGVVAIDVGMNRLDNGRLVGDLDFETAKEIASWITPVPGGVGPMTVAMLLRNTLLAYSQHQA